MTKHKKHKILIVEDEMIIAADISMHLSQLGYEVIGIQTRGEDAINTLEVNRPDLILMDIILAGKMNGIETAIHIKNTSKVPVIFLTSNSDDATFQKAIEAQPFAFIAKPFQAAELTRGLEIAFRHIANEQQEETKDEDQITSLNDRLFIRQKNQMVKVFIKDIVYLEADRNYCNIHTVDKQYLASVPMKNIEEELPAKKFIRTHRSYVVNIDKIEAIGENKEYLVLKDKPIPISRRNRDEVLKYLKLI